jgi:hypothetical protein
MDGRVGAYLGYYRLPPDGRVRGRFLLQILTGIHDADSRFRVLGHLEQHAMRHSLVITLVCRDAARGMPRGTRPGRCVVDVLISGKELGDEYNREAML